MKRIYAVLVAALIATPLSFNSALTAVPLTEGGGSGAALPTKPVKKIVIWDIDDVLIRLNKSGIIKNVLGYVAYGAPHKFSLLKYGVSRAIGYQKSLVKHTAAPGTFVPEGPTYSIALHLKQIPHGDEYFASIGRIVNEQRTYIAGMKEVLEDLIAQDDVLVVAATNKDAIAFKQTAQKLGLEKYFHVVCTSDTDPAGQLLPEKFKKALGADVIRASEGFDYTNHKPIHKHVAHRKPNLEYFNEVSTITKNFMKANGLDTESVESIAFIDDKQENLNAFRKSFEATPFKATDPQPAIQTFRFDKKKEGAEGLLRSGVLSVKTQTAIIQTIALNQRYNQFGGSLLRLWDTLTGTKSK